MMDLVPAQPQTIIKETDSSALPDLSENAAAPLRILIIGSLPPPLGGTSVSLQQLVSDLGTLQNVQLKIVNTNSLIRDKRKARFAGLAALQVALGQIVQNTSTVDIVTLHVSLFALPYIGPLVLLIARFYKKPLLIRRFGGHDHYELRGFKFFLADKTIRTADCYLAQTRAMVERAEAGGIAQVRWFPTSRPRLVSRAESPPRRTCRRFLYLSHVKRAKGIFEIIQAAERLRGDVTVDVYGPFYDELDESIFADCHNVKYHGILPQKQVPQVLADHDALLLPTYYEGEGYPGIILEAFSAGMPVIASRWKAIPELVDESSGLLVEPRDADALCQAMQELSSDDLLFQRLCRGAVARHREFDASLWADRFVEYCRLTVKS